MRDHSLRARITTGTFTLPVTAVLTALVWLSGGVSDDGTWTGLLVTAVVTYLLVELNNRNALLRVRSRMVSTTFLALTAACPFLYLWDTGMVPALCLAAAYFPLFSAYQRQRAAGWAFHAALPIGIGSLFYPPLILLLPVMLVCLAVQLRALGWRSLLAVVFGAALPAWFLAAYGVWEGRLAEVFAPYAAAFRFAPPAYADVPLPRLLAGGFVIVLSLAAIVHFARTAYNDKIRTRMYFYVIIVFEVVLIGALIAQPQSADVLLRLLLVNSAPLLAHHFTLGRGRAADVWFLVCLVLLAGLIGFNLYSAYAGSR